jgi:hypothetical protein
MQPIKRQQKQRDNHGLGTVELAASAFALLIMVLISIDLAVLLIGNQTLDRAARDATRAAASQNSSANAVLAARAALRMHGTPGTYISQPTLTSTSAPDFVFDDYGGTPYGEFIPAGLPNAGQRAGNATVTVTTMCDVILPANFGVIGVSTDQGALAGGKMTFRRTYTFPIVRSDLGANFGGS